MFPFSWILDTDWACEAVAGNSSWPQAAGECIGSDVQRHSSGSCFIFRRSALAICSGMFLQLPFSLSYFIFSPSFCLILSFSVIAEHHIACTHCSCNNAAKVHFSKNLRQKLAAKRFSFAMMRRSTPKDSHFTSGRGKRLAAVGFLSCVCEDRAGSLKAPESSWIWRFAVWISMSRSLLSQSFSLCSSFVCSWTARSGPVTSFVKHCRV